jgi:hypothetical protein
MKQSDLKLIAAAIDRHAKSIDKLTMAVRDLGAGDTATNMDMGAIEYLAHHLGEKIKESGVMVAEELGGTVAHTITKAAERIS